MTFTRITPKFGIRLPQLKKTKKLPAPDYKPTPDEIYEERVRKIRRQRNKILAGLFSVYGLYLGGIITMVHNREAEEARQVQQQQQQAGPIVKQQKANDFGNTPLHDAAGVGNVALAKTALAEGADIHAQNIVGSTVLQFAASSHNPDLVALLLKSGARVNAKNDSGSTALHEAARSGELEIAKLLVGAGADLDDQNDLGYTALNHAATYNRIGVVKFLLEAGADPTIASNGPLKQTPLDLAKIQGHTEIIQLLEARLAGK